MGVKPAAADAPKQPAAKQGKGTPATDASKPKPGSKSEVIFNACKRKGAASVHELQKLTGLGGVVYKYPPHLANKYGLKLVVTKRKGEGDKREVTVFALV